MAAVVTWPRLRKHLQESLDRAHQALTTCADQVEFYRLQGELRAYKRALNLPEAVALVDQEDARAAKEPS